MRNYTEEKMVSFQTRHGARLGAATRAAMFACPLVASLLPALRAAMAMRRRAS